MKKIGILIISLFATISMTDVSAQTNAFYVNNNNVSMTEEQYDYLLNFYTNDNIAEMTQSKFDKEFNNQLVLKKTDNKYIKTITNIDENGQSSSTDIEITKEEYDNPITTYATCTEGVSVDCWDTSYKRLTLTAWVGTGSESDSMRIVILNSWKTMPSVRSYDVIGVRYVNYTPSTAWGDQSTISENNGRRSVSYSYNGSNMNIKSNGIGISQNLIDDASIYYLENRIVIEGKTTSSTLGIYGSYQHAKKTVTLAQSKNYNFGNGLGGVFSFNSGIGSNYDGMQGVKFVY